MAELEGAALEKALAGTKFGAGTKAAIGKGAGAKAVAGKGAAAAKGTIAGKTAMAAKGAGATGSVAKTAAGGAIFSGKGLGLGLGLGSWGPVILGAIGATLVYAYWKKHRNSYDPSETDAEIKDALG
jgi:hypothetical protein